MVTAAETGQLVDRGKGPFNLAEMQTWQEDRTVRAAVLQYLLVAAPWPVHAKGVRLRGVRIGGHLDFEAAALRCPLLLDVCYLDADEPACLDYATASRVTLSGCQLAGLRGEILTAKELDLSRATLTGPLRLAGADITGSLSCRGAQLTGHGQNGYALAADGMKVGGDVRLDEGFTAAGGIRLVGADITGSFSCRGAQLTGHGQDGYALGADGMKVGGNVRLDVGFTAAGAIRLVGADITGQLSCRGAQLTGPYQDGYALAADGVKVGGGAFLDRGFTAAGAIRLLGADIAGQLSCHGAQLTGPYQDGYALAADRVKVGGGAFLDEGFTAAGAISLAGADITGQLICGGAQLTGHGQDGNALAADGMKVGGDVLLDDGFTAAGAIRLAGADITGQLSCRGAHLTGHGQDGNALAADGTKVRGDVLLDDGFTAAGAIRLLGADITGQLSCRGAQLTGHGQDGNALAADGMKVGGDVLLDEGFTAAETVSLDRAQVGGSVVLCPAALASEEKVALDAAGAQIAGKLWWAPEQQVSGRVNLEGTTASELADDWSGERPKGTGLPTGT